MAGALRRLWFVVPSQYTTEFIGSNPDLSLATDGENQGRRAVNGDVEDPMVTDGTLVSPVYLTLDGLRPINAIFFEAGNWIDSDYTNCRIEYGATYTSYGDISETVGIASNTSNIIALGDGAILAIMKEIDDPKLRLRFTSIGTPTAHLSIPNIWIGMGYQMDAMFSIGSTKRHSFLQKPYEKSANGVPLTQRRTGASYGTTIRGWTLSFEWITETQLVNLKEIYRLCQGFRPFKMILKNDGSAFTEPEHYSVTFADKLQVTEVEDGFYTVTMELIEHN